MGFHEREDVPFASGVNSDCGRARRILTPVVILQIAPCQDLSHIAGMGHATFEVGDLKAVIGDNAAADGHRPGYNGLWSLQHRTGKRSLFVPGIAGLNLEHYFNGDNMPDRKVYFEPRTAPMRFQKISETEAELHQPPTPTFFMESWTDFKLVAPDYIDMTFTCVPTQHVFHRGWIGIFWASYINAPLDKSIYFRGGWPQRHGLWTQFCTQEHNDESTVRHIDDQQELEFEEGQETLFKAFSRFRFNDPFYYGHFEKHTWAIMFDRPKEVRFAHSPSGGGANRTLETTNPAWDFQWIIPNYEVSKEYTLRIRAFFRERCSRKEVEAEYRKWAGDRLDGK